MKVDYKALFVSFFEICIFRQSPKVLPESFELTIQLMFFYFMSGVVLLMSNATVERAMLEALMEAVLLCVFIYTLLSFFSVSYRVSQTLLALFGTGGLFTGLSIPLVYFIEVSQVEGGSSGVSGIILLLLFSWSIAVMAYILHKSINKSILMTGLLTICYLFMSFELINLIYPTVI